MKKQFSLFCISLSVLISSCSHQPEKPILGLNESIHHDDFEYSVTGFSITKKIGDDSTALTANGNFYLVTFRVTNHAKRVNHPWDNSVAYLVDDEGNRYENNPDAQRKLNSITSFGWMENYVTTFQSEDSTIFVFDIPAGIKNPYLMVNGETLMGDFLDGNQFEKTKIKLF